MTTTTFDALTIGDLVRPDRHGKLRAVRGTREVTTPDTIVYVDQVSL